MRGSVSMIDGHVDESKMTDNEIKKALECCLIADSKCADCHFSFERHFCKNALLKQTLDLINRLEKDRVEIDNFARAICGERLLKGKKVADFEDLQEYIKKQKSEATKEFTEKAKEELAEWVGADSSITYSRIEKVLDNLAKETMKDSDCNLEVTPKERAECKCPDGCPGTLTIYEQIEMGIKK